jgi:hypothetical protein
LFFGRGLFTTRGALKLEAKLRSLSMLRARACECEHAQHDTPTRADTRTHALHMYMRM